VKVQTVVLSIDHDDYVVRGKSEDRNFSVIYLKNGRVTALDCVNALRDYAEGRYLVMAGSIL
jgi:3-phenylpropionate/trans-cinnamate dioxygenase ferredoxin reductase component